jgi:chemotaxis protein CheD
MTTLVAERTSDANVGMAQIALLERGESARAVLGSCIGLVLYHPTRKMAAVAHIVLPRGENRPGPPGKFADTAIPHMLAQLRERGVPRSGLVAKIAGGANMFGSGGPIQIGRENQAAVKELLKQLQIPIAGEHLAGAKGRRIKFDTTTGALHIEVAGEPSITI